MVWHALFPRNTSQARVAGQALELKHSQRDVKAITTGKNRQITVFSYKIFTTGLTVTS